MALGGFSSRLVHPSTSISAGPSSSNAKRRVALVTRDVVIGGGSSERGPNAGRHSTGARIAEIIDAARPNTGVRVHLWVQARIARQHDEIVSRHVQPGAAGRSREDRQCILDGEILQAHKRGTLDPT